KLEKIDGDRATVSIGNVSCTVPTAPISGKAPGSPVELFVRPEHLHLANGSEASLQGIVAASIYQGGHVDVYIDVPQAVSGRILMRLGARDASGLSGIGAKIAVSIGSEDLVAFPESAT